MAPTTKRGKGNSKADKPSRPQKIRKVKEVVFDEDARKEFLTGFSKRKKAREAAVRNKAIEREREEKNEARRGIREERKERAALNVRNAKALYGDISDSGSDAGSGSDADSDDEGNDEPTGPTAYENAELVTTVSIEPFSLSRSASPILPLRSVSPISDNEDEKKGDSKTKMAVSSHKRRVKNKPQSRLKMTREDKRERAKGKKGLKKAFEKRGGGTKGKGNKG